MDADFAVLTETWLQDKSVSELTQELSLGSALGLLAKNRPLCVNGVCYGAVGFVWRESVGKFKEVPFKNTGGFEVLVRAKLALSDGVTMQMTVRSEDPDVSELVTSTVG